MTPFATQSVSLLPGRRVPRWPGDSLVALLAPAARPAGGRAVHAGTRRIGPQAFTLVEMLVVVAVILLLTTFVVSVFSASAHGDRMRSAARIAQSAFLGARDRALHAYTTTKVAGPANRRGIRLIRDPQDPSLINGFAYIQPIDVSPPLRYGRQAHNGEIRIEYHNYGTGPSPRRVIGSMVDWDLLAQNDVFPYPPRIKIPFDASGQWYTFSNVKLVRAEAPRIVQLDLTTDFENPDYFPPLIAVPFDSPSATCEFELGVELLPNHHPIALPSGVVIDLDNSAVPGLWRHTLSIPASDEIPAGWINLGQDPAQSANVLIGLASLDLMFSPQGMMTGSTAGTGPIYLLLNTVDDAAQNLNPIDPRNKGEKLVLALLPLTGHVQTYPIDPTDTSPQDGVADDLFRFAKQGSAAGQ